MVDVKTVVVSVVIVLSVFLQPGIRPQPTIDSSSVDDSCSQREEEWEFQRIENQRLQSVLESERQKMKTLEDKLRRLRKLELKSVTAKTITSFNQSKTIRPITKVEDKIYVIDRSPNRIEVYEYLISLRFNTNITLSGTSEPWDIVFSNESKCVYIIDRNKNCIWVMTTTSEHRLTKWLNNTIWQNTLSLSNEGHLLVLRGYSLCQLEIYSLNATLIRSLQLPQEIESPVHVVQASDGYFIILHQLSTYSGPYVLSKLTNDGELIHRFIPRKQSETLKFPCHLSLDSENNRLFVADHDNQRVILFDSNDLTWSQVLLSKETNGIGGPWRLFYDASKRHLIVSHWGDVTVYEIN